MSERARIPEYVKDRAIQALLDSPGSRAFASVASDHKMSESTLRRALAQRYGDCNDVNSPAVATTAWEGILGDNVVAFIPHGPYVLD